MSTCVNELGVVSLLLPKNFETYHSDIIKYQIVHGMQIWRKLTTICRITPCWPQASSCALQPGRPSLEASCTTITLFSDRAFLRNRRELLGSLIFFYINVVYSKRLNNLTICWRHCHNDGDLCFVLTICTFTTYQAFSTNNRHKYLTESHEDLLCIILYAWNVRFSK